MITVVVNGCTASVFANDVVLVVALASAADCNIAVVVDVVAVVAIDVATGGVVAGALPRGVASVVAAGDRVAARAMTVVAV